MREIKFRAWNRNFKLKDSAPGKMEYGLHVGIESIFHDCILMQYTGLKDKNGKEIYEGDVASFNDRKYEVVYFAPYWMLSSVDGAFGNSQGGNAWWSAQVEIIGNIYENPEFIK